MLARVVLAVLLLSSCVTSLYGAALNREKEDQILAKHGVNPLKAKALQFWAQSMFGTHKTEFCWRESYGNHAVRPMGCANDEDRIDGTCWTKCDTGEFKGWHRRRSFPTHCFRKCPSGWRDDGMYCNKPSYHRTNGYPLGFKRRCERRQGRKCERGAGGGLFFPVCDSGYAASANYCRKRCPSGWQNIGISCRKPMKRRGWAGKALHSCDYLGSGWQRDPHGALCYRKCRERFNMVGPVCWSQCPVLHRNCGAACSITKRACIINIFKMIKSIVSFALDVVEACLGPLGSAITGLVTAPITMAVGVAEQVDDLVSRFKKGGELTERLLNDKYGKKIRNRIAEEYPHEVAGIITGRAAASYVTMIAFAKKTEGQSESQKEKAWQITNKMQGLPFEVISGAHGKMLKDKNIESGHFFANQAMASMSLPLDTTSLALAASKELPTLKNLQKIFPDKGTEWIGAAADAANKGAKTFGGFMFGVNLLAGAKDIYDAFAHGKCPLNILPKRCSDQKSLCGKHGKCHPTQPWMCVCKNGETRPDCGVNLDDLLEYFEEKDPTERELDARQKRMQS